jgi:hypothetical protein
MIPLIWYSSTKMPTNKPKELRLRKIHWLFLKFVILLTMKLITASLMEEKQ